jgi:hypothetical protein
MTCHVAASRVAVGGAGDGRLQWGSATSRQRDQYWMMVSRTIAQEMLHHYQRVEDETSQASESPDTSNNSTDHRQECPTVAQKNHHVYDKPYLVKLQTVKHLGKLLMVEKTVISTRWKHGTG